jgi:hypothetical protein
MLFHVAHCKIYTLFMVSHMHHALDELVMVNHEKRIADFPFQCNLNEKNTLLENRMLFAVTPLKSTGRPMQIEIVVSPEAFESQMSYVPSKTFSNCLSEATLLISRENQRRSK